MSTGIEQGPAPSNPEMAPMTSPEFGPPPSNPEVAPMSTGIEQGPAPSNPEMAPMTSPEFGPPPSNPEVAPMSTGIEQGPAPNIEMAESYIPETISKNTTINPEQIFGHTSPVSAQSSSDSGAVRGVNLQDLLASQSSSVRKVNRKKG
jgi:hypothetical protein